MDKATAVGSGQLVHRVSGGQELASLGIRFIATSQASTRTSPASKLLKHILAAVAQFERDPIRDRVSAGMRAAKARGTKTGTRSVGRGGFATAMK
jgi:DNA invertase Pin-like site-specific DNA recombinase